MTKNQNQSQKKKTIITCIYAIIIGLLILACAIVIAKVTTKTKVKPSQDVGDDIGGSIDVSTTPTYVAPMENATIVKDYSSTKLQYNDSLKQWEIHKGIDFVANGDANVYAISDGVVTKISTDYLLGTVVEISHSNGLVSKYMSLAKEVNVIEKQKVEAKTLIGQASNTMTRELNSGVHLHLELTLNGVLVDPNNYISLGNK